MKISIIAGIALMTSVCGYAQELVIGTYGGNVYTYYFDGDGFRMTGSTECANASYALAYDGNIYAVSECGDGSGVYSFTTSDGIVKTADLRQTGADPCFVMIHDGRYMMTADYSGGSVSVFPIVEGVLGNRAFQLAFEGSGPVTDRQESSHIHQLRALTGHPEYIIASDLGADVIRVLKVSNTGELSYVKDIPCPAGSGPRHMNSNLCSRSRQTRSMPAEAQTSISTRQESGSTLHTVLTTMV